MYEIPMTFTTATPQVAPTTAPVRQALEEDEKSSTTVPTKGKRGAVQWKPDTQVEDFRYIERMPPLEMRSLFYQQHEYDSFKEEMRAAATIAQVYGNRVLEQAGECSRGLEHLIDEERTAIRAGRRTKSREIVMEEARRVLQEIKEDLKDDSDDSDGEADPLASLVYTNEDGKTTPTPAFAALVAERVAEKYGKLSFDSHLEAHVDAMRSYSEDNMLSFDVEEDVENDNGVNQIVASPSSEEWALEKYEFVEGAAYAVGETSGSSSWPSKYFVSTLVNYCCMAI